MVFRVEKENRMIIEWNLTITTQWLFFFSSKRNHLIAYFQFNLRNWEGEREKGENTPQKPTLPSRLINEINKMWVCGSFFFFWKHFTPLLLLWWAKKKKIQIIIILNHAIKNIFHYLKFRDWNWNGKELCDEKKSF